jgi:hypothetical protein
LAVGGTFEILIRKIGEPALGTTAAWLVSALLLAAAYRLAEAQFQRCELPAKPPTRRLFG